MQLEVGNVFEGKVTGITKFGAFVDIGEGKTGMVHISEVAPFFVSEIRDHLSEGQEVKVKVINLTDNGKIGLSIKKAMDPGKRHEKSERHERYDRPLKRQRTQLGWQGVKRTPEPRSFEDMMSKFKQTSDEKMSDLKKGTESRRGGVSRRTGHSR